MKTDSENNNLEQRVDQKTYVRPVSKRGEKETGVKHYDLVDAASEKVIGHTKVVLLADFDSK